MQGLERACQDRRGLDKRRRINWVMEGVTDGFKIEPRIACWSASNIPRYTLGGGIFASLLQCCRLRMDKPPACPMDGEILTITPLNVV